MAQVAIPDCLGLGLNPVADLPVTPNERLVGRLISLHFLDGMERGVGVAAGSKYRLSLSILGTIVPSPLVRSNGMGGVFLSVGHGNGLERTKVGSGNLEEVVQVYPLPKSPVHYSWSFYAKGRNMAYLTFDSCMVRSGPRSGTVKVCVLGGVGMAVGACYSRVRSIVC